MDYINESILFKIKKVFRYIGLYGISRTIVKVRGQYHLAKKITNLKPVSVNEITKNKTADIAILGCGNFAYTTIAYYLQKKYPNRLRAAMDININHAYSLYKDYNFLYYTDNIEQILEDEQIALVYISSNHASHAEYAIQCIEKGMIVHIEKPHVVNYDQFFRLKEVFDRNPSCKVFLGFNRPKTQLFNRLQKKLKIESGPLMINWFIAGHEISDDHWYYNNEEGGRILGNLCHWTDLTYHLVGKENIFPLIIVPSTPKHSKSDFIVSLQFSDNSCATFTFSAKGHSFEGVKEILNLHKGNVIANLSNFKSLTIERVEKKEKVNLPFRDHGHKINILNSAESIEGEPLDYVLSTAYLFLKIKESIDTQEIIKVDDFNICKFN